jgi:hypothetical protein
MLARLCWGLFPTWECQWGPDPKSIVVSWASTTGLQGRNHRCIPSSHRAYLSQAVVPPPWGDGEGLVLPSPSYPPDLSFVLHLQYNSGRRSSAGTSGRRLLMVWVSSHVLPIRACRCRRDTWSAPETHQSPRLGHLGSPHSHTGYPEEFLSVGNASRAIFHHPALCPCMSLRLASPRPGRHRP